MTPEVVLVCGVGGVGKTTLAAALGIAYAQAGRRAVVVTVDPARRLADALGQDLGASPTPVALEATGSLHALMVDQEHVFDDTVRRLHDDPALVARLLRNRYYLAVSRRLAGTPEYMALETLYGLAHSGRWDVIVVDTPPAGDALDVFRAPRRVARLFGPSALRVVLGPAVGWVGTLARGGVGTLTRLVGSTVLRDIADFFVLIGGMAPAFTRHAREVAALLASKQSRTLLVVDACAPDRADAAGFLTALKREGPTFGGFVVNRVREDPGVQPGSRTIPCPPGVEPEAWRGAIAALTAAADQERREAASHARVLLRLARQGQPVWAVPALEGASSLQALTRLSRALPPAAPARS